MIASILVAAAVVAAVGYALAARDGDELIVRRPYNNRYNDAAGAREDHLG